jgi:hypothetical protein
MADTPVVEHAAIAATTVTAPTLCRTESRIAAIVPRRNALA